MTVAYSRLHSSGGTIGARTDEAMVAPVDPREKDLHVLQLQLPRIRVVLNSNVKTMNAISDGGDALQCCIQPSRPLTKSAVPQRDDTPVHSARVPPC